MSFSDVTMDLLEAFGTSLKLFILTLVFSLPLGLIISFGSMSKFKPLQYTVKTFVWIVRGIPLMLQLFIVFYVPGILFNRGFSDRFMAALVAFVINYACYLSEIYRGGIQSISKGQYEAGQVLGMTKSQIFFKVILLQVVKRIIPPISNEIITLVKDTALARVIAVIEITKKAEEFMATNAMIWPMFYAGGFYLLFVGFLTILLGRVEKKLDYFRI